MATVKQITVDQDASKTIVFEHYINSILPANLFDLTGWDAHMVVRKSDVNGAVVLRFAVGSGLTVGTTDGIVTLDIKPTDTNPLKFKELEYTGYYHLEISKGVKKYRTFEGYFRIRKKSI